MTKLQICVFKRINTLGFFVGLLFLITSCNQKNIVSDSQKTLEITNLLRSQEHAWNRADIKGFMKGYLPSDSLQFITKNGRTLGYKNVLNTYIKHYPSKNEMGILSFSHLIIKPLSDSLEQVYGRWMLTKDKPAGGNFSLIMKNTADGWKIIIDHTW